ncbi:cytokine-like nuclear factor N-PAC [Frankliniella occidentalis]|uniref:Cytokine-like nuclear factor N-PAC n=1 Tax=Frankliniella occidentalis TaxID=133901 RepID=A0A9C6X7Z9_FRAOC|nr:cytokine-like nuclear factor N-PAC [Frankliniella occidentalis]
MPEAFKLGDLVWAKMKGFSPWPGRITAPQKDHKKPVSKKGPCQFVFFFGTKNFAWIEEVNIKPYLSHKEELVKANKSAPFKEAIEEIENFRKGNGTESFDVPEAVDEFDRLKESSVKKEPKSSIVRKNHANKAPKRSSPTISSSGPGRKKARTTSSEDEQDEVASKRSSRSEENSVGNHSTPARKGVGVASILDRPFTAMRPVTPTLDLSNVSKILKEKNINPSQLKFGFLGLGIMGSGMVKNLINSGHNVIVWNRSPDKCDEFVKVGAAHGLTPSDVIQAADITFSCVANPQAAKDMVFGNCGVLLEMGQSKGYVEMTNIDAETSKDISEAIMTKGGRYLEAQVQGSKLQAEDGTLVVLAAGDRSLFDDCQSCFEAMGKNSFFLGDVGNASKMNLVLQLMTGVCLSGLAEGMALADRAGLQQKDVMEILSLTNLNCPLIYEKGNAIIDGGFPTHQALQHMAKDLKLALGMGDTLDHPLPITASVNEVYKHAKRLGYGDHDVSAIYIRTRF